MYCGGIDRVALLLDEQPSLANPCDGGGTPLVFLLAPDGARVGEMIALLVSRGADLNARDSKERTVLDLAVANRFTALAAALRAHGARQAAPA